MLGRLRSRITSRRGASKLEGPSSEGIGSYRQGSNPNGRRTTGRLSRSHQDEVFGLETLYASNKEVHHESAAVASSKQLGTVPSRDGSEEALTSVSTVPDLDKKGIRVETKWTISSN